MACSLFLVINNDHSNRDSDYVFNVDVIVTNRESNGISAEKKEPANSALNKKLSQDIS